MCTSFSIQYLKGTRQKYTRIYYIFSLIKILHILQSCVYYSNIHLKEAPSKCIILQLLIIFRLHANCAPLDAFPPYRSSLENPVKDTFFTRFIPVCMLICAFRSSIGQNIHLFWPVEYINVRMPINMYVYVCVFLPKCSSLNTQMMFFSASKCSCL